MSAMLPYVCPICDKGKNKYQPCPHAYMQAWQYDRAMSLYHRAYDNIQGPNDYAAFCEYMAASGREFDEPELLSESTCKQIWQAAQAAVSAGMAKYDAFPLVAHLEKRGIKVRE